jgi:hypothetical protein
MKNKNKINEFEVPVTNDMLKDKQLTKKLTDLQKDNDEISFKYTKDDGDSSIADIFEDDEVLEPEAVIAPQDNATIKYLSNVIDNKTGEISQPFTIGAQKYQMIRGLANDNQIVMAVFAHDETDDNGCNRIHTIEEFEQKIALPAKQKIEEEEAKAMEESKAMEEAKSMEESKEETYENCKHFLVDTKTNKVRKFKTVEELLSANKTEDEVYMGGPKFRQYMNERLFGKRKKMNELGTEPMNGQQSGNLEDIKMTNTAKNLMKAISKDPAVQHSLDTIKTPQAKKAAILAFAATIKVPANGIGSLLGDIKDMSKQPEEQPLQENIVMTKKELVEAYGKKRNVIKTIKIKDIK